MVSSKYKFRLKNSGHVANVTVNAHVWPVVSGRQAVAAAAAWRDKLSHPGVEPWPVMGISLETPTIDISDCLSIVGMAFACCFAG
jgi:hypothetical protein